MDDLSTLYLLSDAELDAVAAGRHGGGNSGGGTTVEVVEISIGELVLVASGHSNITFNVTGIGSNTTSSKASRQRL